MNNVYHAIDRVSKPKSVPVTERECLWKGGTVLITVPVSARAWEFPSSEGGGRYVQFTKDMKGGVVNLFVHAERPGQFRGKKIVANVEIWKKTLVDGREYLYVDLRPVADAKPTHRLVVIAVEKKGLKIDDLSIAFGTPAPLVGTIVFAPIGSKVLIKSPPAVETKPAEPDRANVTDIRRPAATSSVPATPAMLERLAARYNGQGE